ncbi:coiled-coil domain-containing protein 127-like [Thunnus maccoyii]|uniref:coiled-coil domain-containing protein 127-like n=1 Tax=Thunnus maccoyii TaxID=8240 RepID=UPI001C4C7A75|nr:coiled-coil domain-containing protein 127-like [Thunnus maccoyii]XP_042273035.1 coiled-coil domain-containing protein 127-like [Thunnus maccoyii]
MTSEPEYEGSASGGGNWTSLIFPAVVVSVSLLSKVRRMLWSRNKLEELEVRVRDTQDYIDQVKLQELENLLVERQHVFCSHFSSQERRLQLEEQIEQKAENLKDLDPDIQSRLSRIFSYDDRCGSCLNYIWTGDKTQNGGLMWEDLREWKKRARKLHEGLQEP